VADVAITIRYDQGRYRGSVDHCDPPIRPTGMQPTDPFEPAGHPPDPGPGRSHIDRGPKDDSPLQFTQEGASEGEIGLLEIVVALKLNGEIGTAVAIDVAPDERVVADMPDLQLTGVMAETMVADERELLVSAVV